MLANSYRVLSGTTLLERIDEIASTFGSTDKEQDRFLSIIWSLDSPTLDAARICICFENFFKAELLLKGYIIHRIDKAALTPTYRYLAADQKTRPIKITEIKLAEGLRWKRNNNYSFQTLTPFTIEFTLFLKEPSYKSKIRLPEGVFLALKRINTKRNMLHYLVGDGAVYDQQVIAELQCVKRCFNDYLVMKHNRLLKELQFPDVHIKDPLWTSSDA